MNKVVLLATAVAFYGVSETFAQTNLKTIGTPINTKEYREHAFSISGDGKTFIYVQDRPDGTKVFMSTRQDKASSWESPQIISTITDKIQKGKIMGTSLTYDGRELFFDAILPSGFGDRDIFYAKRLGNNWSDPLNVGEPLNTAMFEGNPSISQDGKMLFFVRENFEKYHGTESCKTIWVANRTDEGGWTNFEKMGEPINSECEKSATLMPDSRTLIFSSIRGGGAGGYDLYQTELQEDGTWTFPRDLDFLNTPSNEEYAAISGNSEEIYIEVKGDIFVAPLPNKFRGSRQVPVNVMVIDAMTKKPIDASVFVAMNSRNSASFSAKNGVSLMQLKAGNNYTLACEAPGYLPANQIKVSLENANGTETVTNTIEMMPKNISYNIKVLDADNNSISNAKIRIFDLSNSQIVPIDIHSNARLVFGNMYGLTVSGGGAEYVGNWIPETSDATDNFIKTVKLDTKAIVATPVAATKTKVDKTENPYVTAPAIDMSKPVETFKLKSDPSITYETKKVYTLNDIYFDRSSVIVKSEYYIDINRLIELMTLNPKLNVQLAGYSDSFGDANINQRISLRRAKSCADYLKRAGINMNRMLVQGLGEREIILDEKGKEDTSKSRRVRFIVY
ncbi:OmpA family protein [Emticicia sp. SJ17W-69]|uniref:OmpA family protein n=1 Tax=Emticicia sp. SJ17W-69 TaxID=3421657 RepID=UPI003EB7D4F4